MLQRAGSNTLGDARFATVLTRSDIAEASAVEAFELSKHSSITFSNSGSPQNVAIDVRRLRKMLDIAGITARSAKKSFHQPTIAASTFLNDLPAPLESASREH